MGVPESDWHATTRLRVTGVEVLQLLLLVVALLLAGARLRVRALRRRRASAEPSRRGAEHIAYDEDFAAPISARRTTAVAPRRTERRGGPARRAHAERDEWPFPDPDAPPPTALLPSTATARRRARALAMSDDRR